MRNAPSFHRAAAYRRSPIDSSSYRYPPADTASSYISGEIAIPLSSRSLFRSPFVRFRPGEFQKRYFMRSLFNPRPFVIARSDTAAILFVRYRATMTEARDCIRFARARALARFYFNVFTMVTAFCGALQRGAFVSRIHTIIGVIGG